MAVSNKHFSWNLKATEDLNDLTAGTGEIYKAVDNTGKVTATATSAVGIVFQGANNGGHVSLLTQGIGKYTAGGGTIAAKALLTVNTSGYLTTAGSGDNVIGTNLETSVASGAVGVGIFDFSVPVALDTSSAFNATYHFFESTTTTDLSSGQVGKCIDSDAGDIALTANAADGVIVTGAASGTAALVVGVGLATVAAGADAVVTKQRSITIDTSGYLVDANSGDMILGRAITAIDSLSTAVGQINFATPHYATSCLDVQY